MQPIQHRILLIAITSMVVTGCGLNSVKPYSLGESIKAGHTVILYGVGMEGNWDSPKFSISLAEYSLKQQNATGNCTRFNHTEADIPSTSKDIQYFAFYAPAGHYAFSAFQRSRLTLNGQPYSVAFAAPEGAAVYLGNFVYTKDSVTELRRDATVIEKNLPSLFPTLAGKVQLAAAIPAQRAKPFVCTP